ncbi:putative ubiquitin-conjugating enzyme E2 38 [Actinidia eriantha]|uniref:putative ubiquitin-conjugating enzyme E2 38 n=1 Tax=Actinidia eriantha TaxID=165200 RepID=UPI00258946BA|nr:putative ubiquitin-conjugating enzyme E2 38 [Actinidia eriantha]
MASPTDPNGEKKEHITAEQFRQFDVVTDDSDHSYTNWPKPTKGKPANGSDCFASGSSGVHKRIMREWKVLEKNLPDSIFVRAYERRVHLLRAAIVGPAGTPYHDGLFFFDLAFPPDYPTRPPHVHYRSFGLRINPNLYASGYVCLSLLNTWFGKANERWNPSESTVLQVLVSIQGLVLNSDPYFNEPGIGIFPGRVKNSIAYRENAFVLSCKTMVYLLRTPPKNFEAFIDSHFRERSRNILEACNAYVNGRVRVGLYTQSGSVSAPLSIKVSNNFKKTMRSWYPELVASFCRTGPSLGNLVEPLRKELETASSSAVHGGTKKEEKKTASYKAITAKKKAAETGIRNVIGKLKGILGFNKVGKKKEKANTDRIEVNSS